MLPKHVSWSIQPHAVAPPSLPGSSLTGTLASDQSMDRSSGEAASLSCTLINEFFSLIVGADRSMQSSDGPAEDEDDLPPLERARQRRNIFFKG
jgi:hypothetical protein